MTWQDRFRSVFLDLYNDERLQGTELWWVKIAVSDAVAAQLRPHIDAVNLGTLGGCVQHGFARLIAVREPGHSGSEAMAEFAVRSSRPFNTVELVNFPKAWECSPIICDFEEAGTPIYPFVDFDQVKDSWRDLPPQL